MSWKRVASHAIRSSCGRWQISKAGVGDGTVYSLWDMQAPATSGGYHEAVEHFPAHAYGGQEAALKAAKEFGELGEIKHKGRAQIEALKQMMESI